MGQGSNKIGKWLNSQDTTSFINYNIIRNPMKSDDGIIRCRSWVDTERVTVPDYISEALSRSFSVSKEAVDEDIYLKNLKNDMGYRAEFSSAFSLAKLNFLKAGGASDVNSENEMSKAQVLVGAPICHTPLSAGSHFVYSEPPSAFAKIDWSWVQDAGKWFASTYKTARATEFALPATTSQGIWLKSSTDSLEWRVMSKVLQAALATRCKSHRDIRKVIESQKKIWETNGYSDLSMSFIQGIRRQQAKKPEPIDNDRVFTSRGNDTLRASLRCQGRIRGIFIPPEFIKVAHKGFSDGLKKSLFQQTKACNVDVHVVEQRLAKATLLLDSMNYSNTKNLALKDKDGQYLGFYDLSAFDTSTHKGLYDLYYVFLKQLFPDFDDREGISLISDMSILFPGDVYRGSYIYKQHVKGRSTLSGQPDVTVKNNVVHLIISSYAAAMSLQISPLEAFQQMCSNDIGVGAVSASFHGDDAYIYLGSDPKKYYEYESHLQGTGVSLSWETQPAYLKKLSSSSSVVKNRRGNNFVDFSGIKSDCIPGSILKNRFGEYSNEDHLLALAGLSDTYCLINPGTGSIDDHGLWSSMLKCIDKTVNPLSDSKKLKDPGFRKELQTQLAAYSDKGLLKANQVKAYLDRLYYSGGEQLDDALESLYGQINYEITDSMEAYNLHKLGLDALIKLCSELQQKIIDQKGVIKKEDYESIFKKHNVLIVLPDRFSGKKKPNALNTPKDKTSLN